MEARVGGVFGDYRLEDCISTSGVSGTVWKVSKETKGSVRILADFALKILKGQLDPDRSDIRTEAVNWSRISQHPNIADFVDIAIQEDEFGDEFVGFVSHYYKENLRQYLRENDISTEEAVRLAINILKGRHIHEHRIIHRDLKPENILVSFGVPYIIDFGISRFVSENMTLRPTRTLGTMEYAAPEAWNHSTHSIRPENDIWSLGVILYEMIEGSRPFKGTEETFEKLVRIEPPRGFQKPIAIELKRVILTALKKEPDERFASADAMRRALEVYEANERTRQAIENDDWDVIVRRLVAGDPKQDELLNLYGEIFPDDGTVLTRENIAEMLEPHLPNRIAKTDNIILVATRNDDLLGFVIAEYYSEQNMAFIPYFAVRPGVNTAFETSKKLLEKLFRVLHKDMGCDYVFFEAQILDSTRARLNRFADLCDRLGLQLRKFEITYQGPKPHLAGKEDDLLFFGVGICSDFGKSIPKDEMIRFLDFIFIKVYGDLYPLESDEFKLYYEHLQEHLEKIGAGLPSDIVVSVYDPNGHQEVGPFLSSMETGSTETGLPTVLKKRAASLSWHECRPVTKRNIKEVCALMQQHFGEETPNQQLILKWQRINRTVMTAIYAKSIRRGVVERHLVGVFKILPLKPLAIDRLESETLCGTNIDEALVAVEGEPFGAIYIGDVVASTQAAKAEVVGQLRNLIYSPSLSGVPVYTRPLTIHGSRLARKYGFEPVADDVVSGSAGRIHRRIS